jgi:DNA-directed RNA polymerase subunit H (RpoH/RPB5)
MGMSVEIDVTGTVADDRKDDRRNIEWLEVSENRRARIRRSRDRMEATREEVARICSPDAAVVHRPATQGEVLRIATRESQADGEGEGAAGI